MRNKAYYIKAYYHRMRPGDCRCFELRMFQDAFPPDYKFGGIYKTSRQAFLSSMVGSAWGAWTVEERPELNETIICRYYEGSKRVYVDPDREHLFYKTSWGELMLKDPKPNT